MRKRLGLLLLLILCSGTLRGQVRTWVATTGLDSNPCTRDAPCRNFSAAIPAVAARGEVVVLESGGYGAVTVTKAVSIISPPGVHAAIAPTSGFGIRISAGADDAVILRGLYVNSQGALEGIEILSGGTVHLERLVVSGFPDAGVDATATGNRVIVLQDSMLRLNEVGMMIRNTTDRTKATINRTRFELNSGGISIREGSEVMLRDSVVSHGTVGILLIGGAAGTRADAVFEDSLVTGASNLCVNMLATSTGQSSLTLTRSVLENSVTGVQLAAFSSLRLARSRVSGHQTGVAVGAGTFFSLQNNTFRDNLTDVSGAVTPVTGI